MITRTRFLFALLLLLIPRAYGQQAGIPPNDIERVGQTGWQFLKINTDARQAAMGSAFPALARGDANAVFGNPAALAEVAGTDLQFGVISWVADIGLQSAVAARTFGDVGTFALSFVTLDYGDIDETVNSPIPGENRTEALVTGATYSARDMAIGLSYSRKITDRLAIGGSVRWLRQGIAELEMTNWSLDFGTLYYTGFHSLRVAVTARNFGPDSKMVGWSEEYQSEAVDVRMPIDFRLGLAMDFLDADGSPHILTVAIDGDHPNDGPEKFHLGAEYGYQGVFFLRGGYKFNYDEQSFTFGAGVQYSFGTVAGAFNYAFVDFGALEQVHMISLGIVL